MTDKPGERLRTDALEYSSYQSGGSTEDASGEFMRLIRVVSANIHKIAQNVSQMNLLIAKKGSQLDDPKLRDKLHQVQHFTSQLSKETNQLVKDLARMPVHGDPSEQRQRKIQRDRLLNDFATVLNNFQSAQRNQKTKEASAAAMTATRGLQLPPAGEEEVVQHDEPFGQHSGQVMADKGALELEMVHQQEAVVQKLERDITDINQIFKDLSMLVHEQGEIVDSIESNMESASINVSQGLNELRQARDYQSKVRRRKMCIGVIVLVIIIVIIIVVSVLASQ